MNERQYLGLARRVLNDDFGRIADVPIRAQRRELLAGRSVSASGDLDSVTTFGERDC